jgi:hypothetical protein
VEKLQARIRTVPLLTFYARKVSYTLLLVEGVSVILLPKKRGIWLNPPTAFSGVHKKARPLVEPGSGGDGLKVWACCLVFRGVLRKQVEVFESMRGVLNNKDFQG